MKPWVRTLMIVAGIMVMLMLLVYTDPTSLRDLINEHRMPARTF
jgi:hypothetical protein